MSGNNTAAINVNWPVAGTYIVTATALNPNATCAPATYTVIVLPAPVISGINGLDSICPNQTNIYSAVSNATGPFSWNITNGTPTFLGANNDSVQIAWAPTGPYSISVSQVSFPDNCMSNTFIKNVFAYPAPVITGAVNVCADNTETYTITNIASGNFQWFITPPSFGTIISGQGTSVVTIKWHGNNNPGFSNTVYLHFGVCSKDSIAVTINEPPTPMITATGSLCAGGVTLSTGATGTFSWTCTEHPIIPTPGNTSGITVGQFGHYHVQIQNYNGSGCTVTANYFVPNTGTPVAHISADNVLNYCLPNVPNMNLIANNAPGYTFQWFLGNSFVGTGQVYPVNGLTLPGTYSYHCVVSLGTCTDTSNVITITIANCPPVLPGPCSNAAINVTNITGCNPFTLTIAATAPAGAMLNTPPNPTITHYEDNTTVSGLTTHNYTTTGYKQVTVCADVLLADNVTVCRVCKDTTVLVNAAANFTGVTGCRRIDLFDASTTIFPATIGTYNWFVGTNPGNVGVPPAVASFNNSTIPNPVLTVNQSGSYIVTLIIKVGSCSLIHMDTFNIHVPDADFSVTNSCVGTTVSFNNLFPEPTNFWSFGDAATSYTSPTFHAYAAASVYTVTHIVTDVNGCKDTTVKPIMIIPAPVCNISFAGPTTFCFGDSLFLNACAGFTNYQWYNNGVAIAGATNLTDTVTQTGNYSFTAISPAGCILNSDTVSITVLQAPNANIVTSGSHCNTGTFFAAVQPCAGCFYQWLIDGNPAGNANQVSGTVGTAPYSVGTHSIIVFVGNPSGCVSSDTITQIFYPLPAVNITVVPNPPLLCSNNVFTLTASTNAALPAWAWHLNNLNTVLSNANTLIASAAGNYTVTVTDGITGCSANAAMTIFPSPDLVLFPAGCDTLCDTAHLFVPLPSLSGNISGYNIDWYDNAPPYVLPVGNGPSFPLNALPTGNHNFSVIVTAPNGCMDTSTVYSVYTRSCLNVVAVRQLELTAKQVGAFGLLSWNTNAESDNDYFIAEKSPDAIQFSFAGKIMSKGNSNTAQHYNLSDPLLYFNRPIYYRIKATDKNGRSSYSNIVKLNPEKLLTEAIAVVPNITRGQTTIYIQSNDAVKTNIMIYAADGKKLMRIPTVLIKGENIFTVNMNMFSSGVYLMAVATNEKQLTARVVKQ